ncbi:MAG: hypothetical protein ACLFU4_00215 [Opitutales bacterium]
MSEGALLEARASLFDSAPLFVPTRWSTSAGDYPDFDARETLAFEDYSPVISLGEELRPQGSFGLEAYPVEQPEDLLEPKFLRPLKSFGQDHREVTGVREWVPRVQVRVIGGGETAAPAPGTILRAERLSVPPAAEAPIRFYVNISASGRLLARPVVAESSGRARADSEVMDWLVDPATIARLPAGYLEVCVYF